MLLKGKKAIITGGARGIGREIVLLFLKEGASVYYLDIMEGDSLPEYQKTAAAAGAGGTAEFRKADVSNEAETTAAVKEILQASGGIDVLVNNAGITRDGLAMRMSLENWQKVLDINLTSAFLVSKHVVADMMKRRSGSIVNMSSIVGIGGNPGQINYSASKAGLIGFTKSLAKEVGTRNVRVNAVAPGYILTDMTEKMSDDAKKAMLTQVPMGRGGTAEEVAKAVLFLACDLSSYVTGRVVQVDGGMAI